MKCDIHSCKKKAAFCQNWFIWNNPVWVKYFCIQHILLIWMEGKQAIQNGYRREYEML